MSETPAQANPTLDDLRMLGNRLLVRRYEASKKTSSGLLYVPETSSQANAPMMWAEVVLKGDEVRADVTVGSTILLPRFGGFDIKVNDEFLTVVTEREVMAVVDGKDGYNA